MPRNVEIKARASNLDAMKERAKQLASDKGVLIVQEDIFFNTPDGRLKLRNIKGSKSQLISYRRPNQEGPKVSDFCRFELDDNDGLKVVLSHALGVKGTVRKERLLVMYNQTRIHLDTVKGLGDFVELEVILDDDQTNEDGEKIAQDIMRALEINSTDLIDCAYMDMILNGDK